MPVSLAWMGEELQAGCQALLCSHSQWFIALLCERGKQRKVLSYFSTELGSNGIQQAIGQYNATLGVCVQRGVHVVGRRLWRREF